jgi:hypothetical protein
VWEKWQFCGEIGTFWWRETANILRLISQHKSLTPDTSNSFYGIVNTYQWATFTLPKLLVTKLSFPSSLVPAGHWLAFISSILWRKEKQLVLRNMHTILQRSYSREWLRRRLDRSSLTIVMNFNLAFTLPSDQDLHYSLFDSLGYFWPRSEPCRSWSEGTDVPADLDLQC